MAEPATPEAFVSLGYRTGTRIGLPEDIARRLGRLK
jgi:hypothetical protein